jgi:hypothetical protein
MLLTAPHPRLGTNHGSAHTARHEGHFVIPAALCLRPWDTPYAAFSIQHHRVGRSNGATTAPGLK